MRTGNDPRLHGRVTLVAVALLIAGATMSIATGDGWIPRDWGNAVVTALIPLVIVFVVWSRVLGNIRIVAGARGMDPLRAPRLALIGSAIGIGLGILVVAGVFLVAR